MTIRKLDSKMPSAMGAFANCKGLSPTDCMTNNSRSDKIRLKTQLIEMKPEIGIAIISHSGMDATDINRNSSAPAPRLTISSSNRMV